MPVEYRTGDLFLTEAEAIGHGCNCEGVMGAGIALQFKKRYPEMYVDYKQECRVGWEPGCVFKWQDTKPGGKLIINMATQKYRGPNARYDWLENALTKALNTPNLNSLAIPWIGTGIGGLKPKNVKEIFDKLGNSTTVKLIVYSF
jgi:O-acetyl-ADP-ribose deacetylase (regulator of RNase III)